MTHKKFLTYEMFGFLNDFRPMTEQRIHDSGIRLINTKGGMHLKIKIKASDSENLHCLVFTITDAQINIMYRQLESVQK